MKITDKKHNPRQSVCVEGGHNDGFRYPVDQSTEQVIREKLSDSYSDTLDESVKVATGKAKGAINFI